MSDKNQTTPALDLASLVKRLAEAEARAEAAEAAAKAAKAAAPKREARVYVAESGYICFAFPGARVYSMAPADVPTFLDGIGARGPMAERAIALATAPETMRKFNAHKAARLLAAK